MLNKKHSRVIFFILAVALLFGITGSAFAFGDAHNTDRATYNADVYHANLQSDMYFCEDAGYVLNRVIVILADNNARRAFTIQPFSGQTPITTRSGLPDLGIAYTEVSLLNPSVNIGDVRWFQSHNFAGGQNNTFLLYLADTGSQAIEEALEILNANPLVEIAERDYIIQSFTQTHTVTPNDPLFINQNSLQHINAPQAWSITTGDRNITIGILDSGLDGTHPDLAPNLWINPNPNQSGFVNDIHGYNFALMEGGTPFDAGATGHGTRVAGIAGARGNNGIGITGVAQNVSLVWLGMRGIEGAAISAAVRGINYAHNNDIRIINASWGSDRDSQSLRNAVRDFNGLFVVSAGNHGLNNDLFPVFPANYNYPNVITVTSLNLNNPHQFERSNFGVQSVNIAAPSMELYTTVPGGGFRSSHTGGTSLAAPHVAGVAALMLSVNPYLSAAELRTIIESTAQSAPDLSGLVSSGGVVDAYAAVLAVYRAKIAPDWLPSLTTNRFHDVPDYPNWRNNPVSWAARNGITMGTSPTTFAPNANVTRAQFVTFFHRMYGSPASSAAAFSDMPGNNDFRVAISWAYAEGITTGRTATTFDPNSPIRREELAAMLHRYIAGGVPAPVDRLGGYTDQASISTWEGAREAVNWAAYHEIMGRDSTVLNPRGNATRAETVAMLYRAVNGFDIPAP